MQKYCSDQAQKCSPGRGHSMFKGPDALVRSDCCRSFLQTEEGLGAEVGGSQGRKGQV